MQNRHVIGIVLANAVLAAGLATPAAAKPDRCLQAIASELRRALSTNVSQIFSGQTPSASLTPAKINKKCPSLSTGIGYTGCPGVGSCAADTDTSLAGYQKCINCITQEAAKSIYLAPHSVTCGNGNLDPGEACDPAQTSSSCKVGDSCSTSCTCFTPPCGKLKFTFVSGTSSCGGAGLAPNGSPPYSGALYDATGGGGNKIADLGLGCLYFGGGSATTVAPGPIPDGSATILKAVCDPSTPNQITLSSDAGTGRTDCTKGPAPDATKHCANEPTRVCTNDAGCDLSGVSKPCQPDPQCYFGPPLSLPNLTSGFESTSACVVNTIAQNAAGTADSSTGEVLLSTYRLTSLIYVTGHFANLCTGGSTPGADCTTPGDPCPGGGACEALSCPVCVNGLCNDGEKVGEACTRTGSKGTTLDCPPIGFLAPLDINLSPLTTGATTKSAADGFFCTDPFCSTGAGACDPNDPNRCNGSGVCSGQINAGAFGKGAQVDVAHTARSITETGSPAGDLTDHLPHDASLAYIFCIPPPGQPATSASDLPGPGAVSLKGTVELQAAP